MSTLNWQGLKAVIGKPVDAAKFNLLIDFCRSIELVKFHKGAIKRTLGGMSIVPFGHSTGTPEDEYPYKGIDASDDSGFKVSIQFGTHNNEAPLVEGSPMIGPVGGSAPTLSLSGGTGIVYAQFEMVTTSQGNIQLSDGEVQSTTTTVPANDVSSDGSGTIYQALFGYNATSTTVDGVTKYSVAISPSIRNSIYVSQCGGALTFTAI